MDIRIDNQNSAKEVSLKKKVLPISILSTSFFFEVINLFGATFGVGSTGLPGSALKVGIYGFFAALTLALISTYFILDYLIYFSENKGLTNYVDLYQYIGGNKVKNFILVMFFLTNIGTLLFSSNTFNSLLSQVMKYCNLDIPFFNTNSLFFLFLILILMTPLNIKRKLEGFDWITYVSFVTAILVIILLFITNANKYKYAFNDSVDFGKEINELGGFNIKYFVSAYFYCMFCFTIQPAYMEMYQMTPNKSVSNMRKTTIGFLIVMFIIYSFFGGLGCYAFSLRKDKLFEGDQFLNLFTQYGNPFVVICSLLMIFAAVACFLFTYKGTKENIGLILFGEKYWKGNSDYNSINSFLTFFIIATTCFISGLFIVLEIKGLKIIGYIVDLVCPLVFMILPLFAYYKVKKSIIALVITLLNTVFLGYAFYSTISEIVGDMQK